MIMIFRVRAQGHTVNARVNTPKRRGLFQAASVVFKNQFVIARHSSGNRALPVVT